MRKLKTLPCAHFLLCECTFSARLAALNGLTGSDSLSLRYSFDQRSESFFFAAFILFYWRRTIHRPGKRVPTKERENSFTSIELSSLDVWCFIIICAKQVWAKTKLYPACVVILYDNKYTTVRGRFRHTLGRFSPTHAHNTHRAIHIPSS